MGKRRDENYNLVSEVPKAERGDVSPVIVGKQEVVVGEKGGVSLI